MHIGTVLIETDRLILRRFAVSDDVAMFKVLVGNRVANIPQKLYNSEKQPRGMPNGKYACRSNRTFKAAA